MEGIDDSFRTTRQRAAQVAPHIFKEHRTFDNDWASVKNFDDLPNSKPDIKYDFLIGYYKLQQADRLSNRLVQFANQVATLAHMKDTEIFKDTSKEIIQWLKASMIQPGDEKLETTIPNDLKVQDPTAPDKIGLSKIPFSIKQQTNQFIALEEFLLSPTMMGDLIFSTTLAGHTLDAVKRVKDFCGLPEDLPQIYRALVWSETWMPDFARVVASLITYTNKTHYVSTPKFQLEKAGADVISATRKMKDFTVQNAGKLYTPPTEYIPSTKIKKESIDTEWSFNI